MIGRTARGGAGELVKLLPVMTSPPAAAASRRKLSGQVAATSTKPGTVKTATSRPPPLAILPTTDLLRSFLLASVSSRPLLLRPTLAFLVWLTNSRRGWLWDADRNPALHFILKNTFYKQFCAGETPAETQETLRRMKSLGFRGTLLTYARETVFDHETNTAHGQGIVSDEKSDPDTCKSIAAWREGALGTADLLGENDQLALKLTGAGPWVTDAFAAGQLPPKAMMNALHDVCVRCREKNARVVLDAESQHYQKGIFLAGMVLAQVYNREGYALVYNTYQAYVKGTPDVLAKHLAMAEEQGFTLGLKLVRGAYLASDQRSLLHDTKQDTDNAYNSISQGALKQQLGEFGRPGGRPFPSVDLLLASHNRESLLAAHQTHQQRVQHGLPTAPLVFAQLQGMSDDLSFDLMRLESRPDGRPGFYKCSTWGSLRECLAYLMRRAAENRDAVSRTTNEYRALKGEVKRRLGLPGSSA